MWEATKSNSDIVLTSDSEEEEEAAEPPTKRTKNDQKSPTYILVPSVTQNNPNEPPGGDDGVLPGVGDEMVTNKDVGDELTNKDVGDRNIEEKLVTDVNQKLVTDNGGQQSPVVAFQPIQSGTRMEPNMEQRFVFQKYHEIILIFSTWFKNGQQTVGPEKDLNLKNNEKEGATSAKARSEISRSDLG